MIFICSIARNTQIVMDYLTMYDLITLQKGNKDYLIEF